MFLLRTFLWKEERGHEWKYVGETTDKDSKVNWHNTIDFVKCEHSETDNCAQQRSSPASKLERRCEE